LGKKPGMLGTIFRKAQNRVQDPAKLTVADALGSKGSLEFDMVLTNPPFGKKSSITVIGEDGDE
jgi:type I restriction enzyme M protein